MKKPEGWRDALAGSIAKTKADPGRSGEAVAGMDLAANIFVGLGLGWIAQRFFPGIKPWGYVGGLLLGAVSGFYQLFKAFGRKKAKP